MRTPLPILPAILLLAALAPRSLADDAVAPADAAHAVSFSHEDVGYANNPYVLRTENRLENMFRALRFCDETADYPEAARYRYHQEVAEPLPFFLSACTPEERARFAKHVREGRIAVAATHTTILADRLTPESAARLFYLSGRHLPDMLDVPAPKAAMINDVTGMPWSLPIYCEAAQVPWLFHGHNGCGRCDELDAAPLVRWRGAGGTGSVLVHGEPYNPYHNPDPAKLLPQYAGRAEAGKLPLLLYGWDFSVTDRRLADAAKAWNAANPGKTVRVATFDDWFAAQEKRATPPTAPLKTGPTQWMDQPITDAWLFGRARQAAERLPAAEKWNALALALAPEAGRAYPWFDLTTGWHALLSNFEHTVGAACWRCKNEEGFVHYETELVEHREEGLAAASASQRTLDDALAALAARIGSPHPDAFAVFNPLARARTEPVLLALSPERAKALAARPLAAVDDATGESFPCQWTAPGTLAFVPKDVPALGYRTFHLVAAQEPAKAAPAAKADAESPFYRIALDPASGCVTSLFDKDLGKELVKQDAPQAFNQYLRLHIENPRAREFLASPRQEAARITVERGPVADIVRVEAKAENLRSLEQTLTLWHGVKRVDFALCIDKEPSGRTLVDYFANNMRGKEAVFVSLPFAVPGAKAAYQTGGGGVAEPVRDQFGGTGTAFHSVQHFADVSNADFGVTVSPVDSSVVEFGPPRADAISRIFPGSERAYEKTPPPGADPATLQMFLMANMYATNIRVDQPGRHAFHWALRSHAGDWAKGGAATFGEGVNQPLAARLLPAARGAAPACSSFAQVDAPNVTLSTLKPAEWNGDGFIVRLVETEGKATAATFKAPFLGALAAAEEVSLTESGLGKPLPVEGGAVRIDLPPFGVKTLRLVSAAPRPAQVADPVATALSDMEVALAWKPAADAACYRVYRGDTADFKPTPLNLVGLTAGTRLVDKAQNHGTGWLANALRQGTGYFYRVEAVSRHNLRGPLSAVAAATTRGEATCAPAPVADLHAIAVSPLAPVCRINLLWRSNVEPNVAGYEIHRSTEARFTPSDKTLVAKASVQESTKATRFKGFNHQTFLDREVRPGTTYHYKVRAVTAAGLPGAFSDEAGATAVREADGQPKQTAPAGKALLGKDAAQ